VPEKGIFQLRTANDLFRKLKHDLKRVTDDPSDSYAAFDFFVTALHISDWKGINNKSKKKLFAESLAPTDKAIWDVCCQLANGSKHFEVFGCYAAVKKTKLSRPAFDGNAFESEAFDVGHLTVRLEEEPAAQLGTTSVGVDALAVKLVEFWQEHLTQ
jgi:hypothetical protein